MLGINEIGNKNALMTGTKDTPSFGNAYTPSFGSTTFHDEFVSSHENGVTVKQIGLFALIGLTIGAGVAMLLKKPSTAATEELEHVVEYQLQERGWLKKFFTKTPEEIQKKAEIEAAKAAAEAKAKEAKIDAQIRLTEAENKIKAARSGLDNSSLETISSNETVLERAKRLNTTPGTEVTEVPGRLRRAARWCNPINHIGQGGRKYQAKVAAEKAFKERQTAAKAAREFEGIEPSLDKPIASAPAPITDATKTERTPELDKARSEFLGTLDAKKLAELDKQGIYFLNGFDKAEERLMYNGERNFEEVWQEQLPARLASLNAKIDGELKQAAECGNGWVAGQYISDGNISYAQARANAMGYFLVETKPGSGSYKLKSE